jgi:hypothetical protein
VYNLAFKRSLNNFSFGGDKAKEWPPANKALKSIKALSA